MKHFLADIPDNKRIPLAISAVLMLVVICLQVHMICTHVFWRDELQSYLIAADSKNLHELVHNTRYEGHPILWHVLLWGASAIYPNIAVLSALQIMVVLASQLLLWRYSPFPWYVTFSISIGYFVFFEYGIIARSYGLGVLLLFLFLAFKERFAAWVILALMANISLHFAALSGVLALYLVWCEKRYNVKGMALYGLGCAFAVFCMIPAADFQPAQPQVGFFTERLSESLLRSSAAIVPMDVSTWSMFWGAMTPSPLGSFIAAAIPFAAMVILRKDLKLACLFMLLYVAMLFISTKFYLGYTRHFGVIYLCIVGLQWIHMERRKRMSQLFTLWMAIVAFSGIWTNMWISKVPFTPMKALGKAVLNHHLENKMWVAYPAWHSIDFSAYIGKPVYNLQKGCMDTWQRWNYHARDDLPVNEVMRRIKNYTMATGGEIYLISGNFRPDRYLGRDLHGSQIAYFNGMMEGVSVYKITAASTEHKRAPMCQ